jgi:hypothetical protein
MWNFSRDILKVAVNTINFGIGKCLNYPFQCAIVSVKVIRVHEPDDIARGARNATVDGIVNAFVGFRADEGGRESKLR